MEPWRERRMVVASLPMLEWLPTSIFTGEATFAYLPRPLPFADIYVPFVTSTAFTNRPEMLKCRGRLPAPRPPCPVPPAWRVGRSTHTRPLPAEAPPPWATAAQREC